MKMLIALDFSEVSDVAFNWVKEQEWGEQTEFRIVHAVEPTYVAPCIAGAYVQPMVEANTQSLKNYRTAVAQKVTELQNAFPGSKVSGLAQIGSPASVILDEAALWNATLIVLGSHGRTGVNRFVMGTVAERVAAHAHCSVSIIKRSPVAPASALNESATLNVR